MAILGPNGAGKSSLIKAIYGELPYVRGSISYHHHTQPRDVIGYVSFDLQEDVMVREDHRDMASSFAGKHGDHQKASDTIREGCPERMVDKEMFDRVVDRLGIRYVLNRGVRYLSSGELRKVLIARALMKSPPILILDEPFAGLDVASRKILQETIGELMADGLHVILVTHRQEEIFSQVTHILCIKDGAVYLKGRRQDILTPENMKALYGSQSEKSHLPREGRLLRRRRDGRNSEIMVRMKNVTVKYGDTIILDRLNWTVRRGENWAVVGPNGSGKSTLLSLITADHPQAYANEINLFGQRRGSGEDIWEIKKHLGVVSSELQVRYRRDMTSFDVVASGLFDSVGLYRHLQEGQRDAVRHWMDFFSITDMGEKIFTRLSYGERRMILLARAMVKAPEMLILDEPCQGLDRKNRRLLLDMVEMIGTHTGTTMIYVTHFAEEMPACINRVLPLIRLSAGAC